MKKRNRKPRGGIRDPGDGSIPEQTGIFKNSFFYSGHHPWSRLLAFSLALVVHGLLFFLLIVIPMSMTGEMPQVEIFNAFLATPLPPPVPPPPAKRHQGSSDRTRTAPSLIQSSAAQGRLVAPVEIPQEITDEQISEIGIEGRVEGGIEGGVVGGKLGGIVGGVFGKDAEGPIRCLGGIKPPRLIKEVAPVFPESLKGRPFKGSSIVIVEAQTDIHGRVVKWKLLRSNPLVDKYVIDAIKQWVYEPMVINGKPRGVIFTVTCRIEVKI